MMSQFLYLHKNHGKRKWMVLSNFEEAYIFVIILQQEKAELGLKEKENSNAHNMSLPQGKQRKLPKGKMMLYFS